MWTSFDKAWVAGAVAFVTQYFVTPWLGLAFSPELQAAVVTVLTAAAAWAMPNKTVG